MSWLDELSELERRATARLAELEPQVAQIEPLLAEYEDLKRLLERLSRERAAGLSTPETTVAAAPAAKPAPGPARKPAARKPAASKPAASKPAASKPAASKPAASKPAAPKRAAASAAAKPAAPRGGGARSRRNAAPPGERERQLLELVASRPGVTVREIAGELGVDPTGLYGIVRRLQAKGRLSKEGAGLRLRETAAEAAPPTASAPAPSAA